MLSSSSLTPAPIAGETAGETAGSPESPGSSCSCCSQDSSAGRPARCLLATNDLHRQIIMLLLNNNIGIILSFIH